MCLRRTRTQVFVVNAPTEKIGLYKTGLADTGFDRGAEAHAALEAYQQQVLYNSIRLSGTRRNVDAR